MTAVTEAAFVAMLPFLARGLVLTLLIAMACAFYLMITVPTPVYLHRVERRLGRG